jgi:hypothetical protein
MVTQIAVARNPLRLFHLHPLIGQLMWNHVGTWRQHLVNRLKVYARPQATERRLSVSASPRSSRR